MLAARALLKAKALDVQAAIRGFLLNLGFKLEKGLRASFDERVSSLVKGKPLLESLICPLLSVKKEILDQLANVERRLLEIIDNDSICQLLMTVPRIGPWTALIFKTSIDEPGRFVKSRSVGAHLGLVPRTYQSGDVEWRGKITKRGDSSARAALYQAAIGFFHRHARDCWLKSWAEQVAARRGRKRAAIAVARRLAVLMHRMWITNTPFRWNTASA
jgi:transposase